MELKNQNILVVLLIHLQASLLIHLCSFFCLGNENHYLKSFKLRSHLNVNILTNSQKTLSKKFANKIEDRWNNTKYSISKNKVPFFNDSLGFIQATVHKKFNAGDHTIILCKINDYSNLKNKKPLIYYKSKYQTF